MVYMRIGVSLYVYYVHMRVYKIPQGKSAINDAQIHVFDIPFISLSIIFLNRLGDPSHMRYHVFMKEFLTAFQQSTPILF